MFELQENIRLTLCPNVTMNKINARCELILKQLKREVDSDCVPCEPLSRAFACCVCGNTDVTCIITDDVQGIQVCGGTNMGGCGNVLNENMFGAQFSGLDFTCPEEQFSPQASFASEWHRGGQKYGRLNHAIERDLVRYGREDMITSDYYKDIQRKDAYDMIDQVGTSLCIDKDVLDVTKLQFHTFRTKMHRIHNLNMVICCLLLLNIRC